MIYEISYKIIFEITAFFWGPLWLYISWDLERKGDKNNFSIKYFGSLVTKYCEIKFKSIFLYSPRAAKASSFESWPPTGKKNYHVLLGYGYFIYINFSLYVPSSWIILCRYSDVKFLKARFNGGPILCGNTTLVSTMHVWISWNLKTFLNNGKRNY